jgi:hypothetical protein
MVVLRAVIFIMVCFDVLCNTALQTVPVKLRRVSALTGPPLKRQPVVCALAAWSVHVLAASNAYATVKTQNVLQAAHVHLQQDIVRFMLILLPRHVLVGPGLQAANFDRQSMSCWHCAAIT